MSVTCLQAARRILDTALASVTSLPEADRQVLPLLVVQYADMELSASWLNQGSGVGHARAFHALSWYLSGEDSSSACETLQQLGLDT